MENSVIAQESDVTLEVDDVRLEGSLTIPEGAQALVVFAHGSGSSRFSPRNQFVARTLNEGGLATLLFDLLTAEEDTVDQDTHEFRFDISLLSGRLAGAVDWVRQQDLTRAMPVGLFGSSTGAAAALIAAAWRPEMVGAVVSRGGRPDLADDALPEVQAPTLLIVGGLDNAVIGLNRLASDQMRVKPHIEIVPGATHLFEEAGKLEEVARLACRWFQEKLAPAAAG